MLPFLADFVAKVGCWLRWASTISFGAAGFDPPALTLSTPSNATQCTEPQQVAVGPYMLRAAVGSGRWRQERTRPGRLSGRAIAVSGCASSGRTASRSFCVHVVIARRPRFRRRNAQHHERLHADRVESCETGPSDSTAL